MSVINDLFTEKFRPKRLDQLIIPQRIYKELERGIIQNLLLHGSPGTGKTSALFILGNPYTNLYINASSQRGIETVREIIPKFCSTISLEGGKEKLKVVILDELDGATEEFYKALRASIERYANVARFIASCNYIQKIPEPIQSRFNCISFDSINKDEENIIFGEYKKRIGKIFCALGISYDDIILNKFIMNDFPDMRALMNKMQSFQSQGIKSLDEKNFNVNFNFQDLFRICVDKNSKPWDNYKLVVSEYSSKIDEAMAALGNDFPQFIKDNYPEKLDKLPLVVIAVAEYQYQINFVVDKMISLLAVIFKTQTILN
jgi:DNA polymerase III delta prime subunit